MDESPVLPPDDEYTTALAFVQMDPEMAARQILLLKDHIIALLEVILKRSECPKEFPPVR
jgi:hypothetical protein